MVELIIFGIVGIYMYAESSDKAAHSKARLISPLLPFDGAEKCLTFNYNVFGKRPSTLSVLDHSSTVLWSATEDKYSNN